MAWGTDLLAGLGGAMGGGLAMHQQQKAEAYRQQRDEQIDDLKRQLQEMKGEQSLKQIQERGKGKLALQELVNSGNLDEGRLRNEGIAYAQELRNQGLLDDEELKQIGRMNLRKEIEAGLFKRNEATIAGAQKRVETQGQTARDVMGIDVGGEIATTGMRTGSAERIATGNRQSAEEIARGRMMANIFDTTVRGQGQAARTRANTRRRGGTDAFEPPPVDWGKFMQDYPTAPAAEPPGMPPRSLRPPTGQVPLNPPPIGGMSPAPPGGVPVASPVAPAPPAALPAPPVAPKLFGPGAGGIASGVSAPSLGGPGMAPRRAAPAPVFPAQAPAAQPNLGEATLAQAGMALGRQIREADKRGDKAAATRLRGELAKLLNPPR